MENNANYVCPATDKFEDVQVTTTWNNPDGTIGKRISTVKQPVFDVLENARKENTDVQQLDKVLSSDNPENVAVVKPENIATIDIPKETYLKQFHVYMKSLGYKEIAELLKISEHIDDDNFNLYKNLPQMTKDYVDSEMKKDKINIKDSKAVKEYTRIKVEDIISQLELDKAFDAFKKDLNEAFQGKDCFEDLFTEDKTRIIENYEKIAQSYENIANSIMNPNPQNTYIVDDIHDKPVSIDENKVNIKYDDTVQGQCDYKSIRTGESIMIEAPGKTDIIENNPKLNYNTDPKVFLAQAKKIRECKDGYIEATKFSSLIDYVKENPTDARRLQDCGKYIKRADRFITEYCSYITRSNLEITEPVKDSIVKLAKTFQVKYDVIMRIFIALVLKLRKYEDGPRKLHYAYYSFQLMKRFYRMDLKNIQTDYVQGLVDDFIKTQWQLSEICNAELNV